MDIAKLAMETSYDGSNYVVGNEPNLKNLWAVIKSLEHKIDNLTFEIRQSLLQLAQPNQGPFEPRERDQS